MFFDQTTLIDICQLSTLFILLIAAVSDLRTRTVGNGFSIIIAVLSSVIAVSGGYPVSAIFIFVGIGALSISLFLLGIWGGADAKICMCLLPSVFFSDIPLWIILFSWVVLFQGVLLGFYLFVKKMDWIEIRRYEFPLVTSIFGTHCLWILIFSPA